MLGTADYTGMICAATAEEIEEWRKAFIRKWRLRHVRSAFKLSNGTYGSPRMTRELQDEGHPVGRRRTARLMRENGLAARQKRRFKRTTDSEHSWPVAPNLLDQVFEAEAPDQKWGVDISYIWTKEGWPYFSIVPDLFSRRVVGWTTSDRLHRALALSALKRAFCKLDHPPRRSPSWADRRSNRAPPQGPCSGSLLQNGWHTSWPNGLGRQ